MLYTAWFWADGIAYQTMQRGLFLRQTGRSSKIDIPKTFPLWSSVALSERESGVFGELKIARINLDVMIAEGLDAATLRRAVGHLESSARPGEPGNVVLLGHRDTFFRPLRDIRQGDIAELRTRHGTFRYRIETTEVVDPDGADVAAANSHGLMLVTCYPFHFLGPSPQRFLAQGRLIEASAQ